MINSQGEVVLDGIDVNEAFEDVATENQLDKCFTAYVEEARVRGEVLSPRSLSRGAAMYGMHVVQRNVKNAMQSQNT